MFIKDIKGFKTEALKALDVLQLSLDLDDLIHFEPQSTDANKILSHISKSPDLFFRFLEWIETKQNTDEFTQMSIHQELLKFLFGLKHFNQNTENIKRLLERVSPYQILQIIRLTLIEELPNWLKFQNSSFEKKARYERTFLNECCQRIEHKIIELNSAHRSIKQDLISLRFMFEDLCQEGFTFLSKFLKRQIDQHLGHKGIRTFINQIRERFSFFSLLQLERGLNGAQLHHLNTHTKLCAEFTRMFSIEFQKRHVSHRKLYPNKIIPFSLIHELGLALLLAYFPKVKQKVLNLAYQNPKTFI